MRRRYPTGVLGVVAMLWMLAACTGEPAAGGAVTQAQVVAGSPSASTVAELQQPEAKPVRPDLHLTVWYPRTLDGRQYLVPERHTVPGTRAVAAAAVTELLRGRPVFPGSRPPFAAGTRLRGVRIHAGTATVDLSREVLRGRPGDPQRYPLQALVYTVTQFPTVKRVVVAVEGRASGTVAGVPLAEFWDVTPGKALVRDPGVRLAPISLVAPGPGAVVQGGRLVVTGEASVHEGTVSLRLRDGDGRVQAQGYATAAAAAPGRGPFSGALTFAAPARSQRWTLEAFEVSAADGSVVYWVHVPVWVGG
jgi:Immunoglobulin-like domain of bacterial spore germination/Sporulation and spore germination